MKHQKDPKYLLRCFNSGKKVCEELHTNLCPVLPKVKSLLQRHLRAAGNQPIRWCHFSSFSTFTNGKKNYLKLGKDEVCFAAHLTNCQIRKFLTLAVETKEQHSYQKIFTLHCSCTRNPKVWGSIPRGSVIFFLCPTLVVRRIEHGSTLSNNMYSPSERVKSTAIQSIPLTGVLSAISTLRQVR